MCLCRLHNFLIDEQELDIPAVDPKNAAHLDRNVAFSNGLSGQNESIVGLRHGILPTDLLDFSHPNQDRLNRRPETEETPMDLMIQHCFDKGLQRPPIQMTYR